MCRPNIWDISRNESIQYISFAYAVLSIGAGVLLLLMPNSPNFYM